MNHFYESLLTASDFSLKKFTLQESVEIVPIENDRQGHPQYAMKNSEKSYVILSEQDYLILQLLKQGLSVGDIGLELFMRYSLLADEYVEELVKHLYLNQFLIPRYQGLREKIALAVKKYYQKKSFIKMKVRWNWPDIDDWVTQNYNKWGFHLFGSVQQKIFLGLILLSLLMIPSLLYSRTFHFLTFNSSYIAGLSLLFVLRTLLTSVHELMHAFTVKFFGRQINNGGIMNHLGLVNFYVDTSDMIMRPKRERMLVMVAGVYSTSVICAFSTLLVSFFNFQWVNDIYIKILGLTLFSLLINLNPLLYFDGYYILVDWLDYPRLRERAINRVRLLWPKILNKDFSFMRNRTDFLFMIYGASSLIWTVFMVTMIFSLLGRRMWIVVHELYQIHSWWIEIISLIGVLFFVAPMLFSFGFSIIYNAKRWGEKLSQTELWKYPLFKTATLLSLPFILFMWPSDFLELLTPLLIVMATVTLLFVTYPLRNQLNQLPWPFYMMVGLFFLSIPIYPWWVEVMLSGVIVFFALWSIKKVSFDCELGIFLRGYFLVLFCGLCLKAFGLIYFRPLLLFHLTALVYLYRSLIWESDLVCSFKWDRDQLAGDRAKLTYIYKLLIRSLVQQIEEIYGGVVKGWILKKAMLTYELPSNDIHSIKRVIKRDIGLFLNAIDLLGKGVGERWLQQFTDNLYWIEREIFEEHIGDHKKMMESVFPQDERMDFLHQIALFNSLSTEELKELILKFHFREFPAGSVIIEQGSEGNEFYILLSGLVKVYRQEKSQDKEDQLAILSRGDIFGERHLYLGEPRNATIKAIKEGSYLYMVREDFWGLLNQFPSLREKIADYIKNEYKFLEFFREIPLFKQMDEEKLKRVSRAFSFAQFQAGEVIVKEGDVGDSFYIIKEGQVEVSVQTNSGERRVLAQMGKGGFFGELALFKDSPRTATVLATDETLLLVLNRAHFQSLFHDDTMIERISSRRLKERELYLGAIK